MDAVETAAPQVMRRSRVREGLPFPLGASWDGLGVNFALFSANATEVELCLFDDVGERELAVLRHSRVPPSSADSRRS